MIAAREDNVQKIKIKPIYLRLPVAINNETEARNIGFKTKTTKSEAVPIVERKIAGKMRRSES